MVDGPAYAHAMRRDELAALGIQLPVLPAIALGPLPGAPAWAARLARIGLDVAASGAAQDTAETIAAARAAAPHLPLKARIAEAAALAGSAALIVETRGSVPARASTGSAPTRTSSRPWGGRAAAVEDASDVRGAAREGARHRATARGPASAL